MRKKATFRGVEEDALDRLAELRDAEQRFVGAIVSDAINHYWMHVFEVDENGDPVG